jgi:hypothetical protein
MILWVELLCLHIEFFELHLQQQNVSNGLSRR